MVLFVCIQKVDPVFWRRKFRFAVFKPGNMADEIPLIDCATSWKKIEHNKFFSREEHRDYSYFAPTACRVLGMTSAAKRANIFDDTVVC
jgi:hypothetical protein